MTTYNPHITGSPITKEAATPTRLPKQFRTARKLHVAFNEDQAQAINAQLDLMESCYGKRISVNRLVKQATLAKAARALNEGGQ